MPVYAAFAAFSIEVRPVGAGTMSPCIGFTITTDQKL